jgi:integrase
MLKLWRRPDAVKGTWRIRGTLGGRRYDESTGTDSRAHAEAIFAKRQKEILDAVTFGAERTTVFGEAVELYLQSGGEARFLEPLVRAFGPRRLADICQADVMRFIGERYPRTGSQGINRQVYTPLIAIYRIAHRAGMGPMPAFIRPKIERKEAVRFATDDDLTKLIPACSPRLVGAVVLMSLGGARASEACRVADPDVDWIRGEVTLRETKNGSPRVICGGASLMGALMPLRGSAGPLFGFASRYSLNQALGRACERAGILPAFSTHEVGRHAFAARHLREGRTLLEVQKLGGWKSYRMVAEVYGHLERSTLDDAMRSTGANLVQAVTGAENVVQIQRKKQ